VLQWNGSKFEVWRIFEFDPQSGAVHLSKYHQDFTVRRSRRTSGGSTSAGTRRPTTHLAGSGYFLLYDGLGWKEVKAQTNKDVRGISFIVRAEGDGLRLANRAGQTPSSTMGSSRMPSSYCTRLIDALMDPSSFLTARIILPT